MASETTGRNPPWTRDEIILALELYKQLKGAWPREGDSKVRALSEMLNRFWHAQGHEGSTLRNENGVKMKLMNLRAHDPLYAAKAGLKAGNRIEREVWDSFAGDFERLTGTAHAIRCAIDAGFNLGVKTADRELLEPGEVEASEGGLLTRMHHLRERSHKIIQTKKNDVLRRKGRLACEACGFDFGEKYGVRGEGFIECHHMKPLADLTETTITKLGDLALLCANCHRMIHAQRPWLTLEELVVLLKDV